MRNRWLTSWMSLGLGVALSLTGSPAMAEVDLRAGETKEVSFPVLVDGEQYLLLFAYSYDTEGEESLSSRVLAADYRSIQPGSEEHTKVIEATKRIMARLLAFMRWKGEQVQAQTGLGTGTGSGLPSGTFGTDDGGGTGTGGRTSTGTGSGFGTSGTGGGGTSPNTGTGGSETLPNGEPIIYRGEKIASSHKVKILETNGNRRRIQIEITAPASTARSIRHLSQALAADPGRYLPRANGTYSFSASVQTDFETPSRQTEPDEKGNVTFTNTYWVTQ